MWRDVLAQAGVAVETVDADHVRLHGAAGDHILRLRRIAYPISSSQVPDPPGEPALLALPKATERTVAAAARNGWNVVTDSGTLSLQLGEQAVRRADRLPEVLTRRARPGPTSWATFTVARRLLAGPPANQVELGRRARVSQSKVSRALSRLSEAVLVERTPVGWQTVDWDGLLDWWLEAYPGPAGVTSYWYSLDDPTTQAKKVLDLLQDGPVSTEAVVSGDVAADLLAPWRRPSAVTLYVHVGVSLSEAGFVPVSSPAEASLTLCAPKDPGVWLPTPWRVGGLLLADPVQVAYDIANGAGSDRDEAVAHFRKALRTKYATRWQAVTTRRSDE